LSQKHVSQNRSLLWILVKTPPAVWPLKAGHDFSIYSSDSHFVKQSGSCQQYAQLGMVLVTPVKFHWNQSHQQFDLWKPDKIFIFIALGPFCNEKQNVSAICTSRDGTDHTCVVSLKSHMQFNLWKPDKIFLFLALAAILCRGAKCASNNAQLGMLGMVLITSVKFQCSLTPAGWPVKARQYISGGHYVQLTRMWRRYVQLGIVLITSV
jgi:hypothetical protein